MKLVNTLAAAVTVAVLVVPVFAQTTPPAAPSTMGKSTMSKPMMHKPMMSKKHMMMGKKGMASKKTMMGKKGMMMHKGSMKSGSMMKKPMTSTTPQARRNHVISPSGTKAAPVITDRAAFFGSKRL